MLPISNVVFDLKLKFIKENNTLTIKKQNQNKRFGENGRQCSVTAMIKITNRPKINTIYI